MSIPSTSTLSECHQSFADYLSEDSTPQTTSVDYLKRTRWFNQTREDIAGNFFLTELLTTKTLSISAGDPTYDLDQDFTRFNALRSFITSHLNIVYTDPYDTSGGVLSITRNLSTGRYQVTITPTPAVN